MNIYRLKIKLGFNRADPNNFIKKGHQYKILPIRKLII